MGLNCGIVGLPNVGKSTIFSALTAAPAEAANYPFCTIEPNVGIVTVPDQRLDKITALIPTKKVIPAVIEFVDIAGLVEGASQGEGLGNKFLSHIREVNMIAQVVRCFEDDDVTHVANRIDPLSDIETINVELALADLETVIKRQERNKKNMRSPAKDVKSLAAMLEPLLVRLYDHLEQGLPARHLELTDDEKEAIADMHLITMKKQIYVCNVGEEDLPKGNAFSDKVKALAEKESTEVVLISGKIEAEIASLEDPADKADFMDAAGLEESGLDQLAHAAYRTLGMRTYFTAGADENRAWTFHEGDKAPRAAGYIHTDFEKGFIKAEVFHCDDLFTLETEQKVKEAGKLRIEGKEYVVKDGDVMHFRFNV